MRGGADRADDCQRAPTALPAVGRPVRASTRGAEEPDTGRGYGASAEDAGRQALYALRKQTPEPVFGILKEVLGFRQFLLRSLESARGEWSMVTMAWNLKRMFALSLA
jgi:hypothetical protein